LSALSADFIGTSILHTVFYFSGAYILQHKPRWLPIPVKAIERIKLRLSKKGLTGIYIGRLTPFIRGYTSVISGLLQIRTRKFLPIALITATIWSSAYAITGMLLGPVWSHIISHISYFKYVMLSLLIILFLFFLFFNRLRPATEKIT
jgi:alkaline phosphatase